MTMYAQISLVGRVTHDVELRARATTGEPYLQLGLAVNEGYKDHVHTSYYQCWLESEEATRASKAGVRKGSLLFVNGQLSVVDVPRKDGSTRTVVDFSPFLVLDDVSYRTEYAPCEALNAFANSLISPY